MTDERMPPPGDEGTPGAVPAGAQSAPTAATQPSTPDARTRNLEPAETPREEGFDGGDAVSHPAEAPPPSDERVAGDAASVPSDVSDGAQRPTVTSVSPDVDLAQDASPLPGAHRGGFHRLPTAPVAVTVETAPAEPGGEFHPDDTPWTATDSAFHRGLAAWALAFAIVGLIVSMFVGWGFPIGLVAVVSAIIALRRPLESRAVAVWAIVLGTLSILYSAGWLLYAAAQAGFLG